MSVMRLQQEIKSMKQRSLDISYDSSTRATSRFILNTEEGVINPLELKNDGDGNISEKTLSENSYISRNSNELPLENNAQDKDGLRENSHSLSDEILDQVTSELNFIKLSDETEPENRDAISQVISPTMVASTEERTQRDNVIYESSHHTDEAEFINIPELQTDLAIDYRDTRDNGHSEKNTVPSSILRTEVVDFAIRIRYCIYFFS